MPFPPQRAHSRPCRAMYTGLLDPSKRMHACRIELGQSWNPPELHRRSMCDHAEESINYLQHAIAWEGKEPSQLHRALAYAPSFLASNPRGEAGQSTGCSLWIGLDKLFLFLILSFFSFYFLPPFLFLSPIPLTFQICSGLN
mmetsp:Transcript_28740/g.56312  ORF Transcript_28740/g.56312 Transcript_28740/m.56312 type:complete len:142 (-) Transcript_28740:801-1226(-)